MNVQVATILFACAMFAGLTLLPDIASAQIEDFTEFYRVMQIGPLELPMFCYPIANPENERSAIGVQRDTLGRPVTITRFFFGNLDARMDWTTMRLEYHHIDTAGSIVQRRTYHNPSGAPIQVGIAYGEDILYDEVGNIRLRTRIDREGNPVTRVNDLVRSFYTWQGPGLYQQEWRYSNGKQQSGTGFDNELYTSAELPTVAFFRYFRVNDDGALVEEAARDISKKPTPFPGGEYIRRYKVNECGLPIRTSYHDAEGKPMVNNNGFAYETFSYDSAGRVIKWEGFGVDGKPHGRASDGAAVVTRAFRAFDGALLSEEKKDAAGKVL